MKREIKKSFRVWYGKKNEKSKATEYFEAGIVKGSEHPVNNIYLKSFSRSKRKEDFEWDFTIDEAATIISVLGEAIATYTSSKRKMLRPKVK